VRRRGVYFAMVTIAFGQVFYYIAFQWSSLTGGDDGLRGFSRQPIDLGFFSFDILSNEKNFYFFVLFCFALAVGAMGFILRSPFGRTMIAIRENERRSRFLGIPVERHIWIAFTLSCFFMGFAGALYALVNNFADPRGLHYSQSGDFVMMAVMGGMRSFWGPLLGAAVFVVLQDYLSSVTVNWMSFVGLLFILVVLFFPRGLLGFLQQSRRRERHLAQRGQGRIVRDHRAERRRQDHLLQPDQRIFSADLRRHHLRRPRHHQALHPSARHARDGQNVPDHRNLPRTHRVRERPHCRGSRRRIPVAAVDQPRGNRENPSAC
jgi:hypothetical protein